MDPLLQKIVPPLPPPGRRRIAAIMAVGGIVVLVGAVLVSALGAGAGGSTTTYPAAANTPRIAVAATPTPSALLVQVGGAVRHPGLVSVPAGARAVDAVTAAGGPTARADSTALNLAARVVDGQQLVLPERGRAGAAAAAPSSEAQSGAPVSLSTASAAELETLPRVGPAMAARIITYRTAHGPFAATTDLMRVAGIGQKTFDSLKDLVLP